MGFRAAEQLNESQHATNSDWRIVDNIFGMFGE